MSEMPENSVDLIVTSPPYNSSQEYEKELTIEEYREQANKWAVEMFRVVKHRVCLNVAFDTETKERNNVPIPLVQIWQNALSRAGFKYRDSIIWNKGASSKQCTAWGSWCSASAPHQRHIAEIILVYYKGDWKIGPGENNIKSSEFAISTTNIWDISPSSRDGHPCPYPVELAERCIKLYSHKGAIVLDPFLGSGTTLLACRNTDRVGIGFEIDSKYEKVIIKRSMSNIPNLEEFG
jgi:site-specific DNA-methyltransferase (adenine-specific)